MDSSPSSPSSSSLLKDDTMESNGRNRAMSEPPELRRRITPFKAGLVRYEFKVEDEHPLANLTKEKVKDRNFWHDYLQLDEIRDLNMYRCAFVEFVATCLLTFISISVVITTVNFGYTAAPQAIALVHIPFVALMILGTAAASGGHMNPLTTLATFACGITSLPRALMYVIGQSVGSILGSALIYAIVGHDIASLTNLGACAPGSLGQGRALISEVLFCLVFLYIVFEIALHPSQKEAVPGILAPIFISIVLGICIWASAGLNPDSGYSGFGGNPARCFGPAVIYGEWKGHWVYWVGPIIACILNAAYYRIVPINHEIIQPKVLRQRANIGNNNISAEFTSKNV